MDETDLKNNNTTKILSYLDMICLIIAVSIRLHEFRLVSTLRLGFSNVGEYLKLKLYLKLRTSNTFFVFCICISKICKNEIQNTFKTFMTK